MIHYTDEIRAGSPAETVGYRPSSGYRLLEEDPQATLSIYPPGGAGAIVSGQPMVWDPDEHGLKTTLDTSDARLWPKGNNYMAEVRFTTDEMSRVRVFYFDVLADPWRPNLTTADIMKLSGTAALGDDAESPDYSEPIAEAEERLRIRLRARGLSPGQIRNKAALDRCHRMLGLSYLYLHASTGEESAFWNKHRTFQKLYERSFSELLSAVELDVDQDNRPDRPSQKAQARLQP